MTGKDPHNRFVPSVILILLLGLIYSITTYPYDFSVTNELQWIDEGQGIYFNGNATAATKKCRSILPVDAISVQLLVKERYGSKNWGPRYIFSLYDGPGDPTLVVGQWAGKIFVYSKYAVSGNKKYYHTFSDTKRLPLNKPSLITVTIGSKQQALYINKRLANRRAMPKHQSGTLRFTGRYLLGNSPRGNQGWWGEIKGLAVYERVLPKDEIRTHSEKVLTSGITALADTNSLISLYPFDEGQGWIAKNNGSAGCSIHIPKARYAYAGTLLDPPMNDIHGNAFASLDFLMNILFFMPLGAILYKILSTYTQRTLICLCLASLAALFVSLSIEYIQLYLSTRVATIVDIVGNVSGAIIGGLLEVTRRCVFRRKRSAES